MNGRAYALAAAREAAIRLLPYVAIVLALVGLVALFGWLGHR